MSGATQIATSFRALGLWPSKRVKSVVSFVTSGPRGWGQYYSDDGSVFLRIGNLQRDSIELDLASLQHVQPPIGAEGSRTRVLAGDVLVSITADIGSVAVVRTPLGEAYVNQHIALLRPMPGQVDSRWLAYALCSHAGREQLLQSMYGGTKQGLGLEDVKEIWLFAPSLTEQRAIADYLDRKTKAIDELIQKKKRLIELLQAKRQALITQAVTKGLDLTVPMKDSGIEWLGDIPAHWKVKRLKHVSPQITVGIVITPSKYYVDEGVPALRSLNVRPGRVIGTDLVFISPESNELLRKSKLAAGDLVAVRTGQPGTTTVVPSEFNGANCIDLIIIRRSPKYDSRFLCHVMNAEPSHVQYDSGSEGAIQQHFNIETAKNLVLALPPVDEQRHTSNELDARLERVDCLLKRVRTHIELLHEYRQALISAAVTGKTDVTKEMAC